MTTLRIKIYTLWTLICVMLFCIAWKPGGQARPSGTMPSGWNLLTRNNAYKYSSTSAAGQNGDLSTWNFTSVPNTSFLVTNLTGNLTGKTLSTTVTISTTGTPTFIFAQPSAGCTYPASFVLYFTSTPGLFDINAANNNPNAHWYSVAKTIFVGGVLVVSVPLDPALWSNALGKLGSAQLSGFNTCVASIRQAGFGYGGGCYFDDGVGISGNGTATYHLNSYQAQ